MPERQNLITYDSMEVQGEGSWIKIRSITHGESKRFLAEWSDVIGGSNADLTPERRAEFQAASDQLVVDKVIDWNWVNDDGDPLPLPCDDPAVVDLLTEQEHTFIGHAMRGDRERKK